MTSLFSHAFLLVLLLAGSVAAAGKGGSALRLHQLAAHLGVPPLGREYDTAGELPPEFLTQASSRFLKIPNISY